MVDLEIHPVQPAEVPALVEASGQAGYVRHRLAKQDLDLGVLLAAWLGARAVGSVYLWLEEPEEPEINQHLPGLPLITHLEVFATADRKRGVGRRLVMTAEQLLRRRGYSAAVLAVELTNVDAARLYKRLGYQDWGHGLVTCTRSDWLADGTLKRTPEECAVLVTSLG
jgi:GNAT superfamily N-acetyltransferase